MDRGDIPEVLFSCIREDDPYRASKLLQIERWCYVKLAFASKRWQKNDIILLHKYCLMKNVGRKVNNLHRVKLNRQW
ncbi:hypothetical protein GZ065_01440 [Wolbachia endosymbiont of Diaphorina citri]|uniref:hypothetical protein n=1 Tax=Wolbachia endosymbiont of Diaphorina citri TaxID=116598 RepID=UPI002240E197|nr:hypothetical protein [Wolbachia endosymbiont of Diaphorina citri]QXY87892.1 hypothetical protein GZ065_01440 [Wolbachia endosymbiont of Diaphorina citri]